MSGELNMFSTFFNYRIAILGEPRVGKTSILNQLVNNVFHSAYTPTLETDMEYLHEYKATTYVCLIVDTAGVKEFPAMRRLSITRSNGFLIVFDLSDEESFKKAEDAVNEVLKYKEKEIINILLIGNKRDLIIDSDEKGQYLNEMARCLREELQRNRYVSCQYFEVTAMNNAEITKMFERLLDLYDEKHLKEGSGLMANLFGHRRRLLNQDENEAILGHANNRLSADFKSFQSDSSELEEKRKRYSLPKTLFSSPLLERKNKTIIEVPAEKH